MENDIFDSLNDLGYDGPLKDEEALTKAIDGGPKSLEYTKLVHILAQEIKGLLNLEETVNVIDDVEESSTFVLELSSFLKEIGCPYKNLTTGHISSRLESREDRLLVLDYLISELMSARMVKVNEQQNGKPQTKLNIIMEESPIAKDLKEILMKLKFNKPPANITAELIFSKLESRLKESLQKEGDQLIGKPLYNKAMTEKEWEALEATYAEMFEEYRLRKETLITRLECTIQSFEWSERLKGKRDVIQSTYRPKREQLKAKPTIRLSDFLAARTSLLLTEKTSNANVRKHTQSEVTKVIIGAVPDRGGRPNEQQPPPPEMPSWQQQRTAPQGGQGRGGGGGGGGGGGRGGGGGGRGGRGGGGRVQGGYSQATGDQSRPQSGPNTHQVQRNYQTYEVPPGGYGQTQDGGYHQNRGRGNQNQGGYNHSQGGYNHSQGGYNHSQGGYNQSQGGYSQNQGGHQSQGYNQGYPNQGYNNNQGGYNQSQGGYGGYQGGYDSMGSYNQGGGYQNYQGQGQNYQSRGEGGGQRGRGGYRGGRR